MRNIERHIIKISVDDALSILENSPVQGDFFPQITIIQVMNRVSIAHLSIERAIKYLITQSGVSLGDIQFHDLGRLYSELTRLDSDSAAFLERAFHSGVAHYRYKPNAAKMSHLKTVERYLKASGSDKVFQDVRYWELNQSMDEALLGKIYLNIHIELLHALNEVLLEPDRPMETVSERVERGVRIAFDQICELSYVPGTEREHSVNSYLQWLQSHSSFRDALADAVKRNFKIGDAFAQETVRKVYDTLLQADDPAVKYFAFCLDVVPKQPRDVLPNVEWIGPDRERIGEVKSPGGTNLGLIQRHLDGLWYITIFRAGPMGPSAKATTQTDARCYVAAAMSRAGRITVDGIEHSTRIVGDSREMLRWAYPQSNPSDPDKSEITLWDGNHEIRKGQWIRIEAQRPGKDVFTDKIEGYVEDVKESRISIVGNHTTIINDGGSPSEFAFS